MSPHPKEDKVKDLAIVGIRNVSKKTNGNSDICFGVPKQWRDLLGIKGDYMGGDYAIARIVENTNTGKWIIKYEKIEIKQKDI